jgi:hypothetical protein
MAESKAKIMPHRITHIYKYNNINTLKYSAGVDHNVQKWGPHKGSGAWMQTGAHYAGCGIFCRRPAGRRMGFQPSRLLLDPVKEDCSG